MADSISDDVLRHRRLVRRGAAYFAAGSLLSVLTLTYFTDKMGTVTLTPEPFVFALYLAAAVLLLLAATSWLAARRLRASVVASSPENLG